MSSAHGAAWRLVGSVACRRLPTTASDRTDLQSPSTICDQHTTALAQLHPGNPVDAHRAERCYVARGVVGLSCQAMESGADTPFRRTAAPLRDLTVAHHSTDITALRS